MEESRNFGPLLPKFNGQETGKFIYLQLNYSLGSLEIISIEDERIILVQRNNLFQSLSFLEHPDWITC